MLFMTASDKMKVNCLKTNVILWKTVKMRCLSLEIVMGVLKLVMILE